MDLIAPGIFQSLVRWCRTQAERVHAPGIARAASTRTVSLPMNGSLDVEHARGCRIRCLRGSLWITHEGDERDTVVEAGSTFVGDRDTPMFVQALVTSEFTVVIGRNPRDR